jgi:hypothetical protein
MVPIGVTITASDDSGGPVQVQLLAATSNEPDDAGGRHDGRTGNDIRTMRDGRIRVRAERAVRGNGRVYALTWAGEDPSGNRALAQAAISVPLERPSPR